MPKAKITTKRYTLFYKDLINNKWVENGKFSSIDEISKKINVSIITGYNILNSKAKKYNLFYKIVKIKE